MFLGGYAFGFTHLSVKYYKTSVSYFGNALWWTSFLSKCFIVLHYLFLQGEGLRQCNGDYPEIQGTCFTPPPPPPPKKKKKKEKVF